MLHEHQLADINATLSVADSVSDAVQTSRTHASQLYDSYAQAYQKALGEVAVVKAKLPQVMTGLQTVQAGLEQFITMSAEVWEAQTFKSRIDEVEGQLKALKLAETCLVVAMDFEANLASFATLCQSTVATEDLTSLVASLLPHDQLLDWWSKCESNSGVVEAFGYWRFSKFLKIEAELRKHVHAILSQCFSETMSQDASDGQEVALKNLQQLLRYCEHYSVLGGDFRNLMTTLLTEWYQSTCDGTNWVDRISRLFDIFDEAHAINAVNELISANLRSSKTDLDAMADLLNFQLDRPVTEDINFASDVVSITWSSTVPENPQKLQLHPSFVEEVYKYHLFQILQVLPISVKSTMQALSHSQAIADVLGHISEQLTQAMPAVQERLECLLKHIQPPEWKFIAQEVDREFVRGTTQSLYHPIVTTFNNSKMTAPYLMAFLTQLTRDVIVPLYGYIGKYYGRDVQELSYGQTVLEPVQTLIINNVIEDVRKDYEALIENHIGGLTKSDDDAQSDIQPLAGYTLDLLKLFFPDAVEPVNEIETTLLPSTILSLLEIYLQQVSECNISSSLQRCARVGLDIVALLKLGSSLLNLDDNERTISYDSEIVERIGVVQSNLRNIAHACADALDAESDPACSKINSALQSLELDSNSASRPNTS